VLYILSKISLDYNTLLVRGVSKPNYSWRGGEARQRNRASKRIACSLCVFACCCGCCYCKWHHLSVQQRSCMAASGLAAVTESRG